MECHCRHDGRRLCVYGTDSDVGMAATVHIYITIVHMCIKRIPYHTANRQRDRETERDEKHTPFVNLQSLTSTMHAV